MRKSRFNVFGVGCIIVALLAMGCGTDPKNDTALADETAAPEQENEVSDAGDDAENPKEDSNKLVSEKDIHIGVTSMTLKEVVYGFVNEAMVKRAQEYGNVTVDWVACENDASVQMSQVEGYIQQGVDIIIIEPARSDACVKMVEACNDAGIPVINMNAAITGIQVDYRVDSNSELVGQMQVEKFVELYGTDKPAKVAVIGGSVGDECAETITKAVQEACEKYDNIEVVLTQMHQNWDRQLAMNTMENLCVQYPDLNAVFSNNDTMALGCMKAAQDAGVADNIYFFGADWDQDSAELILGGATNLYVVNKGANDQGIKMVDTAVDIANGREPAYDEEVDGTKIKYSVMSMVGPENINEEVQAKYPELLK